MRLRVCHVITGLQPGGAEHSLLRLILDTKDEIDHSVISLTSGGALAPAIRENARELCEMGWSPTLRSAFSLPHLRGALGTVPHDIYQGWMHHGNVAALLVGARRGPVVWNIRKTIYDLSREKLGTRLAIQLGARLSSLASAITYNSDVSRNQHDRLGYHSALGRVIHNGVDLASFVGSPQSRDVVRARLGIPPDAVVVARIGRFHPMKDQAAFLRAMSRVIQEHPTAFGLLIGNGVERAESGLVKLARDLGIAERTRFVPDSRNVPDLLCASDVNCSSSAWGESFPNVLAEGMAMGVPAVATDIGDTAEVVGDTGIIVAASDIPALANALTVLVADPSLRRALGASARARVRSRFSLQTNSQAFLRLYLELSRGPA